MKAIESKIKTVLLDNGIDCQSVYSIPDQEAARILLAFNSKDNMRLTTKKIEKVLNSMDLGQFEVPRDFQRLSAAFLHLEVVMGARVEKVPEISAR